MAWKLREDSDSFKMWQNTTNYRRIQIMRMGFDPKKAVWDVEVENGRGKKGFTTKAKAVAFAKQKMEELDERIRGHKMAVGTETLYRPRGVSIKTGRTNWIAAFWYQSRKDALQIVKRGGRDRDYTSIEIVPAPSRQYKGKYITVDRISKYQF